MKYQEMQSGEKYLIQVTRGDLGFIGTGYYGTFKGVKSGQAVFENSEKVNLVTLAMGNEKTEKVGTLRIPLDDIEHISIPKRK